MADRALDLLAAPTFLDTVGRLATFRLYAVRAAAGFLVTLHFVPESEGRR